MRNPQEDRCVDVYAPGSALDGNGWVPLVTAVVCVTRRTPINFAATGFLTRREETALYASSVMLPTEIFGCAIPNHWSIESKNHWVRDVTLTEDAGRIRISPGVMARLRSQARDIARANGAINIADALWNAAIDPTVSL